MRFDDLVRRVLPTGLFRTGDILAGASNPNSVRRQLDRWVKSGKIAQLRREVYQLQKPYCTMLPHPFLTANVLRRASYVSLQSALSHYGMIPEHVPVATSITGGRPEDLDTSMGRFLFRHIQARNFFGFLEREIAPGQFARIATPEKALADLLYLDVGSDHPDYLAELRLEPPDGFDSAALAETVERMNSPKLKRAVARLLQHWEEEAMYETIVD